MAVTKIEWTDHSVNPLRARLDGRVGHYCEKLSPGCKNCYASRLQPRFGMPQFAEQRRLDVETVLDPKKLDEVLRRRKPTKYFWCDMTDMFGEWVTNEQIEKCFQVMAATPQHTHQVLTKRADRLPDVFEWLKSSANLERLLPCGAPFLEWPLPNVWLGVSCEDQQRADERIAHLLATPTAVRFVSAEPLLGRIDLRRHLGMHCEGCGLYGNEVQWCRLGSGYDDGHIDGPDAACGPLTRDPSVPGVDWVIVGSESGHGARPMQTAWARSIVDQCVEAGVAVFTKQISNGRDRKGGNPAHWPSGEWPREMPNG